MHVAVVLDGDGLTTSEAQALRLADAVVCADGGARHAMQAGVEPAVVVGDMDSIGRDVMQWLDAHGVPLERHPVAKDETDGELALVAARRRGATRVTLFGCGGGGLGHTIGHLALLRRLRRHGIDAEARTADGTTRYLVEGDVWSLVARQGGHLDVNPDGGRASVAMEGMRWSAEGLELEPDSTRGIGNVVEADDAFIAVIDGAAFATLH